MKISKSPFGQVENQDVDLYTLENDNGMVVKITNYGGIVTSLVTPDSHGAKADITCGFNKLESYFGDAYKANSPYFGCIVGRYAGMIKDGKITVEGKALQLNQNANPHHLHGGTKAFDKNIWNAKAIEGQDKVSLELTRTSPDGEENYPGNLDVTVVFSLNNDNELAIEYAGETDKTTPLSMTHHAYFNLGGFQDKILKHKATILADKFLLPDESGVPDGKEQPVANTVWDFNTAKEIGSVFAENDGGFEHYYIFKSPLTFLGKVAEFHDVATGRTMEVASSEPGMLFYTGKYTSDELKREDGTKFGQFRAFCCETSRYINGPNIDGSPASLLKPGEKYSSTTVFKFSW